MLTLPRNRPMCPASIHSLTFNLLYVPLFIATILVTAGGLLLADTETWGYTRGNFEMRAGVIIFAITLLSEAMITGITYFRMRRYQNQASFSEEWVVKREQQVLLFVLESIPFLMVRLVYSFLASFMQQSVAVRAVTAVLMETIVVGIYLIIGLIIPPTQFCKTAELSDYGESLFEEKERCE